MRVQFSVVGDTRPYEGPIRADLDAVPRVGDTVELPGLVASLTHVRTVVWYPMGDPEASTPINEPFVYVVLGTRRP